MTDGIMLGRWRRPEEIAQGIVFLMSPAAAAVYGQIQPDNSRNHMA